MNRLPIISVIFISALLLGGCGKETPVTGGSQKPIRFSAGMSVTTKAQKPDDPTVLLSVGNQAGIFGTRVVALESEQVFFNRVLRCDAVPDPLTPTLPYSSVWNYSPFEYWKDTGNYYFTGVFPYSNDNASIDNTYYLNVSYQAGSNTDLMVARAYRDASVSTDPVNLEFKHTTSAVRFLFGKSSDSPSDGYELTYFQLESIAASGTFKILTRITDPSGDPISSSNWTTGALSNISTWLAEAAEDRKEITHPADADDPDGYTPMGWYYMVPQTLSAGAAVRFMVSYNGEDPVENVLSITDCDGVPGADTWIPNCVYNYYIMLTQSGLNVNIKATPWDDVQVTTEDFNFEG